MHVSNHDPIEFIIQTNIQKKKERKKERKKFDQNTNTIQIIL
jgi:hypothetical protein